MQWTQSDECEERHASVSRGGTDEQLEPSVLCSEKRSCQECWEAQDGGPDHLLGWERSSHRGPSVLAKLCH